MRVKFLRYWSGARGSYNVGDEAEVSDPIGVSLVAASFAEQVIPPQNPASPAPAVATDKDKPK